MVKSYSFVPATCLSPNENTTVGILGDLAYLSIFKQTHPPTNQPPLPSPSLPPRFPSTNPSSQNKDSCHTQIHLHAARHADLFEDFCGPHARLPDDDVWVPPQHRPVNPEDEDDVVPDQHAAFGIQKATQRGRGEPAWRDLGLGALMSQGPAGGAGGGAGGGGRGVAAAVGAGAGAKGSGGGLARGLPR